MTVVLRGYNGKGSSGNKRYKDFMAVNDHDLDRRIWSRFMGWVGRLIMKPLILILLLLGLQQDTQMTCYEWCLHNQCTQAIRLRAFMEHDFCVVK